MILLSRLDQERTTDGEVHKAVWQPACICIPLLRPHRHPRLPERIVTTRSGGVFLPSGGRCAGCGQDYPLATHRRLPEVGGGLWPQSQDSHRMGREGCTQGGLRATSSAPDGEEECL